MTHHEATVFLLAQHFLPEYNNNVKGETHQNMRYVTRTAAAAILLSASLFAQNPFGVVTANTAPDPATVVANEVAHLTRLLTLTTAQQTQATTIFTSALKAITPLETTLATDRTSLAAAVKSNSASTIDSVSANLGLLTGQITALQNKADAAFYVILTADQKTKLDNSGGFNNVGGGPGGGGHH